MNLTDLTTRYGKFKLHLFSVCLLFSSSAVSELNPEALTKTETMDIQQRCFQMLTGTTYGLGRHLMLSTYEQVQIKRCVETESRRKHKSLVDTRYFKGGLTDMEFRKKSITDQNRPSDFQSDSDREAVFDGRQRQPRDSARNSETLPGYSILRAR